MFLSPREWIYSSFSCSASGQHATEQKYTNQATKIRHNDEPQHLLLVKKLSNRGIALPIYQTHANLSDTHQGFELDWENVPASIDPMNFMSIDRGCRKRQQIENMVLATQHILSEMKRRISININIPLTVVDFCCGSGHLGLVLAFIFGPLIKVILVEKNPVATMKARQRVHDLSNEITLINNNRIGKSCPYYIHPIEVVTGTVEEFNRPFDVGVAIHACGPLSDWIHQKCLKQRAAYVLCPCCVGKVQQFKESSWNYHKEKLFSNSRGVDNPTNDNIYNNADLQQEIDSNKLIFPRSLEFRSAIFHTTKSSDRTSHNMQQNLEEYFNLSKYGDYGEWEFDTKLAKERRLCKSFIESDRNMASKEQGYQTFLVKMVPENCTPKNDIIAGWLSE